jgi:hypothetical protein
MPRPTLGRTLVKGLIISAVIQAPIFALVSGVGIHGELGGIWFFFYLPAIFILNLFPTSSPLNFFTSARHSVMGTLVELFILQLLLVAIIIFLILALWNWLRASHRRETG